MATFSVPVVKITIEEHPDADTLEIANIQGYQSIVRKGQFKTGDFVVYIPEQALLPNWLIERLGLVGKLAGSNKNRVKAIKLRGVLSQGLLYPVVNVFEKGISNAIEDSDGNHHVVHEGQDVSKILGIMKYEPKIPVHLAGDVDNLSGYTLKYDIENFKNYPDILDENEEVVLSEKLHGTWSICGYHPHLGIDRPIISSKGLSAKGLAFKLNENNKDNLYVKTFNSLNKNNSLILKLKDLFNDQPVYLLGEIFGSGVQDLTYGQGTPIFNAFDIYVGDPGKGRFLNFTEFVDACDTINISRVPTLYVGNFNKELMLKITNGLDTISHLHIREGIVIKPTVERYDRKLGRVILKSVSEDYLLRKNGTEFN